MSTARISAAELRARTKRQPRVKVAPAAERTFDGTVFHSKSEALFAARLETWKVVGIVEKWERQVAYPLDGARLVRPHEGARIVMPVYPRFGERRAVTVCEAALVGTIRVDFRVTLASGLVVLFEVKPPYRSGMFNSRGGGGTQDLAMWKMKHFRAQYPERLLLVVCWKRARLCVWPDTSLEDLYRLADAGLVLDSQ